MPAQIDVRVDVHVDVWVAFEEEAGQDALLSEYRALLTDEEQRTEQRFHFPEDRRRYVITRALVRTVLSRYTAAMPPQDWRFVKDDYGRPHVVPAQRSPDLPNFNLSHSHGLVVCAVTHAERIGIDVERLGRARASMDIADHYFAPAEANALRALPAAQQSERFIHYWTLKESYIKAHGKGLAMPLRQFAFDLRGARDLGLAFEPPLEDEPANWKFWLWQASATHVAAVAVARAENATPRLLMRRVVPLRSEAPFECEMLRESA